MPLPSSNGIFIHDGLNCSPAYIPTSQSIPMSPSDATTVKTAVDNKSDLSIIADEYDTSATYTIGDFVIYDKVLYKCIMHSTTGDWDSTRWVAVNSKDSGINLKNSSGNNLVKVWEDSSGNGTISLYDKTTGYDTVSLNGYGGIDAKSITVMTSGSSNSGRIELTTTQSNSGYISLRDDNKNTPIELNADDGNINAVSLNGVAIGSSPKFTDTTYESKTAASGGTAVSLCTTGEKYTWNSKAEKPSVYRYAGEMLNATGNNIKGVGEATIFLNNGIARIDFTVRITVADTSTSVYTWGINTEYFTTTVGKTIIPIRGGKFDYFRYDGTINYDRQGFGGAFEIDTSTNKYWRPARIYKSSSNPDVYSTGMWATNLFGADHIFSGVCYGTYT